MKPWHGRVWLTVALLSACSKRAPPIQPPEANRPAAAPLPQATTQTDEEVPGDLEVPTPTTADLAGLPAVAEDVVDFAAAQAQTGEALVWRSLGKGHETLWLSVQPGPSSPHRPGQAPRIVARRAGIWLAFGEDIWGLHTTRRRLAACDRARCEQDDTDCARLPPSQAPASVDDLSLVGLTSRRKIALEPRLPASTAVDLAATDLTQTVSPWAQLGDRMVVATRTAYTACGQTAGRARIEVALRQLPNSMTQVVATPGEQAGLLAAEAGLAGSLFETLHGRTKGVTRWIGVHQQLSPQGQWLFEYQVDREAALGQGDGRTEPGRVSVRVPAHRLPGTLATVAEQAPHVEGLVPSTDSGADPHAGWSWLRLTGPARDAALAAFQASKAPP